MFEQGGDGHLFLGGQKISGADIRDQNGKNICPTQNLIMLLIHYVVLATQAIANVVRTSFGPSGLDKMMVDDIGVCLSSLKSSPAHPKQLNSPFHPI